MDRAIRAAIARIAARPRRLGGGSHARPVRRDGRDPRRPRRPRADGPPPPGRRRIGQDRRGRVRARGGGARRRSGGAPRPDRPPRATASRDAPVAPRGPRAPGRPPRPGRSPPPRLARPGTALEDGRGADRRGDARAHLGERVLQRLALAVVDEQHRFGVAQRAALEAKSSRGRAARPPHDRDARSRARWARSSTRTSTSPTSARRPRDGCPSGPGSAGRTTSTARGQRVRDARRRRATGRSSSSRSSRRTSPRRASRREGEAERLRELLFPLRVGLVHGRMKPAARDAEMERFRSTATSTSSSGPPSSRSASTCRRRR